MDLKILLDTPPWEWPKNAGRMFHQALTDPQASESDRLVAAELAGDYTVVDEELVEDLLAVVGNPKEPTGLRAKAAISLGPVLEQGDTDGFDDPDDVPITEPTFVHIKDSLHKFYLDPAAPKELKRRILEVSVRSPEPWHPEAIRAAYSSGDKEWLLTAVFAMRWVRGFDQQILASLNSDNPDIHYEALMAAGNWGLDGAWPHIVKLLKDRRTPKRLLLAAIEAAGYINPMESRRILADLSDSDDEEIADAASEAMSMAEAGSHSDDDDDDEEGEDEEGEEDGHKWVN